MKIIEVLKCCMFVCFNFSLRQVLWSQ